jgi:hypothetical protein
VSREKSFGWKPTKLEGESKFVVKEFNNEVFLINASPLSFIREAIEVSEKGSLAFLALGSIGHQVWQKVKSISKKHAKT